MENDIEKKLYRIVLGNAKIKPENMDESENFDLLNDLGYDSINIFKIILHIEKTFNIKFGYSDLDNMVITNYSKLVEIVKEKFNEHEVI